MTSILKWSGRWVSNECFSAARHEMFIAPLA